MISHRLVEGLDSRHLEMEDRAGKELAIDPGDHHMVQMGVMGIIVAATAMDLDMAGQVGERIRYTGIKSGCIPPGLE